LLIQGTLQLLSGNVALQTSLENTVRLVATVTSERDGALTRLGQLTSVISDREVQIALLTERQRMELQLARQERDAAVSALERVSVNCVAFLPDCYALLCSYGPGCVKQRTLSKDTNRTCSMRGCCRTTAELDSTQ
jgi:hypothetical protein